MTQDGYIAALLIVAKGYWRLERAGCIDTKDEPEYEHWKNVTDLHLAEVRRHDAEQNGPKVIQ